MLEKVRPWVVMVTAVGLIVGAFVNHDAATLMLGCTMLGSEPLARAGKEPPPPLQPNGLAVPA